MQITNVIFFKWYCQEEGPLEAILAYSRPRKIGGNDQRRSSAAERSRPSAINTPETRKL